MLEGRCSGSADKQSLIRAAISSGHSSGTLHACGCLSGVKFACMQLAMWESRILMPCRSKECHRPPETRMFHPHRIKAKDYLAARNCFL